MTAEITVEQLSKQIGGVPIDRLIAELGRAGIKVTGPTDVVSASAKDQLLLRLSKNLPPQSSNKLLRGTQVSQIRVTDSFGKKQKINIVRKTTKTKESQELIANSIQQSTATNNKDVQDSKNKIELPEVTSNIGSTTEHKKELEKQAIDNVVETAATPQLQVNNTTSTTQVVSTIAEETSTKKPSKKVSHESDNEYSSRKSKKSKAQLIEEDNQRGGRYRKKRKPAKIEESFNVNPHGFAKPVEAQIYEVKIPLTTTAAELAQQMAVKSSVVIKSLMQLGTMVTINQSIDRDTAYLVVEEMGHKPIFVQEHILEDTIVVNYDNASIVPRPPIVTVMGHVDHGKTSLLDAIRRFDLRHPDTNETLTDPSISKEGVSFAEIAKGEAGGITQHIGAYMVHFKNHSITFLDTPGHAAFTAMRARGANCTDIVVLVVAADDGVMLQTIEAIQHAKAAGVPIVVAINKIDKHEADKDRITQELAQNGLLPEAWGGDTQFIPVSAKTGAGLDSLLEAILLQCELLELKAPNSGPGQGIIIEARLDRGRGPIATALVQKGALQVGDMILAGFEYGRVKKIMNEHGQSISKATPSVPVEILGLSSVPNAGDTFQVVVDEKKAKEIAFHRQMKARDLRLAHKHISLEGFIDKIKQESISSLNIILKADVQGSLEALSNSLVDLSTEAIAVKIIAKGVGAFTESDVNLAIASNAIMIGFNIRAEAQARALAKEEGIEIYYYSIIYEVIDGVKAAITGRTKPTYIDKIIGLAEVRSVFRSSKIGSIAGCMVVDGIIKRGNKIRVLRNNVVIYNGELESLRRFKDSVNEVRNGAECGIGVKNYNDVQEGDQIEVYETVLA